MVRMNSFSNYMTPYENSEPIREQTHSYNKIADFLYLGNIDSLKDQDKFYLIVNCTKHIPPATKCKEVIVIPVNDHSSECNNMIRFMKEARVLERIHQCRANSQPVLIHCHAGIQRSAAVLACYLIHYYKMSVKDAMKYIQKRRPIAFYPEANFMKVMEKEYSTVIYSK